MSELNNGLIGNFLGRVAGDWAQGLALTRLVLLHLSEIPSPADKKILFEFSVHNFSEGYPHMLMEDAVETKQLLILMPFTHVQITPIYKADEKRWKKERKFKQPHIYESSQFYL